MALQERVVCVAEELGAVVVHNLDIVVAVVSLTTEIRGQLRHAAGYAAIGQAYGLKRTVCSPTRMVTGSGSFSRNTISDLFVVMALYT